MTYTPNGKVANVADGKGNLTTYVYDGLDRLSQTQFPTAGSGGVSNPADYEQLYYDGSTSVVGAKRFRDGRIAGFATDALNRVIYIDSPHFAGEVNSSFTYDNFGRMLTASDQNGHSAVLTYDALGRVVTELGTYQTKTMQYDLAGRRTRLTWQDGFHVTYDYLVTGEMATIRENGSAVLASYSYDDLGRRSAASFGNGTSRSYGYDVALNLGALNWTLPGGTGDARSFAYNPAGQITSRTSANDAYAWTGHYNVNRAYASNGLNQYTQSGAVMPTYDARGNLTTAGSTVYSYNSKNEMIGAGGNSLYYDPLGRLDQMAQSNRRFDYDGTNLITELNTLSQVLRRYVHGPGTDEPVVWYEGSGTSDKRWLHADEHGSIVAVTSGTGSVLAINAYDEYGIPKSTNLGRFQYTGQAWLAELGLYYYKARMYSPTLGRFLQTDPIGYGDGLNWYNYVGNDPVNARDPSGLKSPPGRNGFNGCSFCGEANGTGLGSATDRATDDIIVTAYKATPTFLSSRSGTSFGPIGTLPNNDFHFKVEDFAFCSASELFEQMRKPGVSAPGAPYARENTNGDIPLTGGNPITQSVNVSERTITNLTQIGHRYHPGTVVIRVTPTFFGSRVSIEGRGGGPYLLENRIGGFAIFTALAARATLSCTFN